MLYPTKKKIPHVQGRSPNKLAGGAKIMFRIKPQTFQRFLEGANKTFCAPGPRERSSDPTIDWARLAVSVQESLAEVWVNSGLLEQAWEQQHAGISPFEGGRHYHHYPYHSLANYREGTQPHPSAENWIKDLLSMTLPTRVEQACFTHS